MQSRAVDFIRDKNKTLSETLSNLIDYGESNIPLQRITKVSCVINNSKVKKMTGINNKAVLSLATCKKLDLIKVLQEIKSEKTLKNKEKDEEAEAKAQKVDGRNGEELKNAIVKLYPDVFSVMGRLERAYKSLMNALSGLTH